MGYAVEDIMFKGGKQKKTGVGKFWEREKREEAGINGIGHK
jgi:hypothetical protein